MADQEIRVKIAADTTGLASFKDAQDAVDAAIRQVAQASIAATAEQKAYAQALQMATTGAIAESVAVDIVSEHLKTQQATAEALRSAKANLADAQAYLTALTANEATQIKFLTESYGQAIEETRLFAFAQEEAGTASVSATMAANLAGREVGGFLGGALGRVLATSSSLGPIFSAAFPIIGAVALAQIVYQLGEHFEKVRQQAQEAADNIDRSFTEVTDAVRNENDSLLNECVRTQEQIDKLLGTPEKNVLTAEFEEAASAADKLADSINHDIDRMEQLISVENKKNTIGFWGSLFSGKAETGDTQKLLTDAEKSIRAVNDEYADVLDRARASGDKENLFQVQEHQLAELQTAYKAAEDSVNKSLQSMLDKQYTFEHSGIGEDYTANINMARNALREWASEEENIGEQFRLENEKQQVVPLQAQHAATAAAEKAQRELQALSNATSRLVDENAKAEEEALEKVSKAATQIGNSPLLESISRSISGTTNADAQKHFGQMAEDLARGAEATKSLETDTRGLNDALNQAVDDYIKLGQAQIQASADQEEFRTKLNQAMIRAHEATGQITGLAAAHAMAAEHTRHYREELDQLEADLAEYVKRGKEVEAQDTSNAIARVQAQQNVTGIQDQVRIAQQSAQPWIQAATQIGDAYSAAFTKIVIGGEGARFAMLHASEQMVSALLGDAERFVIRKLELYAMDVIHHAMAETQKTGATAAANATAQAATAATNVSEALSYAAVAAAGAAAAVAAIPIVGPALAPAAAAATYADTSAFAALAAFDTGGIVPRDGVIMAHEKEAVLPQHLTTFLLNAASQQSGSSRPGVRDLNLNYYGGRHAGPDEMMSHLERTARHLNLTR